MAEVSGTLIIDLVKSDVVNVECKGSTLTIKVRRTRKDAEKHPFDLPKLAQQIFAATHVRDV